MNCNYDALTEWKSYYFLVENNCKLESLLKREKDSLIIQCLLPGILNWESMLNVKIDDLLCALETNNMDSIVNLLIKMQRYRESIAFYPLFDKKILDIKNKKYRKKILDNFPKYGRSDIADLKYLGNICDESINYNIDLFNPDALAASIKILDLKNYFSKIHWDKCKMETQKLSFVDILEHIEVFPLQDILLYGLLNFSKDEIDTLHLAKMMVKEN